MDQKNQNQSGNVPQDSAEIGSVRKDSATLGNFPQNAETFGKIPPDSESFRNIPQPSERKENHTLTVREVARMFETAGVARSERSIVNWCQPNRQGIPRLDSYYDPNERKYFIAPQSVEAVIAEEKARAAAKTLQSTESSESFHTLPKQSEEPPIQHGNHLQSENDRAREMEREILDLKIANRGKDYYIERMEKERTGFFDQLLAASRKVGELEAKVYQIESANSKTGADQPTI